MLTAAVVRAAFQQPSQESRWPETQNVIAVSGRARYGAMHHGHSMSFPKNVRNRLRSAGACA